MAEVVERKLQSGAYASVSEVLRDGVRALMERDAAIDRWRQKQALGRTWLRRRELLDGVVLDAQRAALLQEFLREQESDT